MEHLSTQAAEGNTPAIPDKDGVFTVQAPTGPDESPDEPFADADLRTHFSAIRFHHKTINEHEREIYNIVRRSHGDILASHDTRRTMLVNMQTVIDRLFYAIGYAIDAAELHAKSMCSLNRM